MIGLVVSDFPGCMKVSCRQVYAHREMCRTRTCCSFIAEACACQPVLVQLFPDVRSLLSTSLALSRPLPFPFLSSPTRLFLASKPRQHPPPVHILYVIGIGCNIPYRRVCYIYDMDKNSFVCLDVSEISSRPKTPGNRGLM